MSVNLKFSNFTWSQLEYLFFARTQIRWQFASGNAQKTNAPFSMGCGASVFDQILALLAAWFPVHASRKIFMAYLLLKDCPPRATGSNLFWCFRGISVLILRSIKKKNGWLSAALSFISAPSTMSLLEMKGLFVSSWVGGTGRLRGRTRGKKRRNLSDFCFFKASLVGACFHCWSVL